MICEHALIHIVIYPQPDKCADASKNERGKRNFADAPECGQQSAQCHTYTDSYPGGFHIVIVYSVILYIKVNVYVSIYI